MFTENKIYRSGNYIILEAIGETVPFEYAISKTVYTRQETPTDVFIIAESGVDRTASGRKQILLSDVIAGAWKDEGGTAYDETTLTTFFRENTGFNPTSGGSGVGVNSVTGDGVGGTASNVVLTFPDADEVDDSLTTNKFVTDAEKIKLAGLESSKFVGEFISLPALQAAFPTAPVGSYAYVDTGAGQPVEKYIWDNNDSQWELQQGQSTAETPASIKSKYESNPDTNSFTDSEKTNLSNQSNTNTGDETTSSIQSKRPLKTVGSEILEGAGNVKLPEYSKIVVFDSTPLNNFNTNVFTDVPGMQITIDRDGDYTFYAALNCNNDQNEEVDFTIGLTPITDRTIDTPDSGTVTVLAGTQFISTFQAVNDTQRKKQDQTLDATFLLDNLEDGDSVDFLLNTRNDNCDLSNRRAYGYTINRND